MSEREHKAQLLDKSSQEMHCVVTEELEESSILGVVL